MPTIINDQARNHGESLPTFVITRGSGGVETRRLSAGLSQLFRLHYDIANPRRETALRNCFRFQARRSKTDCANSKIVGANQNARWILDVA